MNNYYGMATVIAQIAMFLGFILLILSSITVSNNFNLSMSGHICIIVGILMLICTIGLINDSTITLSTKTVNIFPFVILAIPIIILISLTNKQAHAFSKQLVPEIYYDYYTYLIWTICFILSLYAILVSYTSNYYKVPVIDVTENRQAKITVVIFLILSITCYILYVNTLGYILDYYITDRLIGA